MNLSGKNQNKILIKKIFSIALIVYFAFVIICLGPFSKTASGGEENGLYKPRSRESINEVLMSYNGSIAFLYRKALRDNPALKGTVTVKFTIEPSGQIINARIVSSTIHNDEFEQQILICIRTWRFLPLPGSGDTVIKYPLSLEQE